jgi:hypothetical protein
MNATENLFSFLPESNFCSSFLQDIKWYKRSLFGKEFKKDVIENNTLADLVIGLNADPEWIRKKIVKPSAKEKYCPSFSTSLYALTVIAYELQQYSERRIVGDEMQQRFDSLLAYFSINRVFYSPNAKGFFEAIMTCPTETPDLKKTLSLLFTSLHCETVHYTAKSSNVYFPAMVSKFLIAKKAGIANHQLIIRDNIANEFLDPNFLFREMIDIEGSISAWLTTLDKDQYGKAAMYFFFDYLPVLGQLSYYALMITEATEQMATVVKGKTFGLDLHMLDSLHPRELANLVINSLNTNPNHFAEDVSRLVENCDLNPSTTIDGYRAINTTFKEVESTFREIYDNASSDDEIIQFVRKYSFISNDAEVTMAECQQISAINDIIEGIDPNFLENSNPISF